MSTQDNMAPEEIEGEIEHTRSEMRETLDAIQSKLTPRQMMGDMMDYFRSGPGTFASNLGRVARDNPVPVAMVGFGLAWLAMSQARRRPDYETDYDEMEYYGASAGGVYGSTVSAAGGEAGSSYESYASSYGSEPGYEQEGEGMAGGAREQMGRVGHKAREQAQRAREGLSEMVEHQPLMMAAAAFVLGAALGALLPATRREDRMMGGTRDELAHRATEMGREGMERVKQTAQETWTRVSDETLQTGASSEGGSRGASEGTTASGRQSASSSTASAAKPTGASSNVKPGGAAGSTPTGTGETSKKS